ncbi:MAG: hypothetical protein DMF83_22930, partial [Acidobacteria bacterium]
MNADFRACPACGSRNKPKWEFCARCGESLQGVPLGESTPVEAALEEEEDQNISSAAFPWVTGLGLLAFGTLAVAVTVSSEKRAPDRRPNPGIFTLPTLPASAPPARPAVKDAGAEA